MPRESQVMIRTALIWMALGVTAGGLMLLNKGVPLLPWLWTLRVPHVHMLLVGWMVQFACGVAFWILPRLDAGGARGDQRLIWGCYAALNSGVVVGTLHALLRTVSNWKVLDALPPLMGALYLLSAGLFVAQAWPRVRPFQTHVRLE
jgi:hypothetical protein